MIGFTFTLSTCRLLLVSGLSRRCPAYAHPLGSHSTWVNHSTLYHVVAVANHSIRIVNNTKYKKMLKNVRCTALVTM